MQPGQLSGTTCPGNTAALLHKHSGANEGAHMAEPLSGTLVRGTNHIQKLIAL